MQNDVVLTMRGICKSFPGTRALHNVDFTLRKGGEVTERDVTTHEELEALLKEEFGIEIHPEVNII